MRRFLALIAALTLVASACGGSDDTTETDATTQATTAATTVATTAATTTTTQATITTTAATTTTPAVAGPADRPAAAVNGVLELSYFTTGTFDPAVMGFDIGEVTAEWYTSEDGFYVVVYEGLDLDSVGPLCPGNSVQFSDGSFNFISNDPTPGADCIGFTTLTTDPDVGALVCDGVLSYRTAIPIDSAGALYGTIEKNVDDGIMGVSSVALTTDGDFPVIDLAILSC